MKDTFQIMLVNKLFTDLCELAERSDLKERFDHICPKPLNINRGKQGCEKFLPMNGLIVCKAAKPSANAGCSQDVINSQ